MARTKPTEARDKILEAERTRLGKLKLNADFERDLTELEAVAKRLATAPAGRIPVSKLSSAMTKKDLLPTDDETLFHDLAERFRKNWNFQPRWNDDGGVELSIPMPAGEYKTLPGGETIETTRRGYHPDGHVDALAKYYRSLRQLVGEKRGKRQPQRRRRPNTDQQRLKVLELRAAGKTITQIAQALYRRQYRDIVAEHKKAQRRLDQLTAKLMVQYRVDKRRARQNAAAQLGLDPSPLSVKLKPLTQQVRHLLKSSRLQK